MKNKFKRGWVYGAGTMIAARSLWEDWMGRAALVEYTQDQSNWIDSRYTVPFAIGLLIMVVGGAAMEIATARVVDLRNSENKIHR